MSGDVSYRLPIKNLTNERGGNDVMSDSDQLVALVQKTISSKVVGKGSYAVTTSEGVDGSVTFSLNKPIWAESEWPEPGTYVILTGVFKTRSGWRARKARLYGLRDENSCQITSSEQ